MKFSDKLAGDQRRTILEALAQDSGYTHNTAILQMVLDEVGHNLSSAVIQSHCHYLAEQGLIDLTDDTTPVAKLTARGLDVADGRATATGIARRRP